MTWIRLPQYALLAGAVFAIGWWAASAVNTGTASAQTEGLPPEVDKPEVIKEGRKVFAQTCGNFECHNFYGGGGLVPDARKINDQKWHNIQGSYQEIVNVLANGIPGTPMISWTNKLGAERIQAVAAYVYLLSRGQAPKE